jgi:hypothetical protein
MKLFFPFKITVVEQMNGWLSVNFNSVIRTFYCVSAFTV